MRYTRNFLGFVVILLASCLTAGPSLAAEFSAVVVSRKDSQETKGKIFLQGEKMRQEFTTPEGMTVNISRPDQQVMWVLVPDRKMAMEIPFSNAETGKLMALPQDQNQMKLLGTETVNGYDTEKYEILMKTDGKIVKEHMWLSKKLGVPIKMVSVSGKYSMEYQEIKEGGVPESLFEVPQGYQKMAMPQGMPRDHK